MRIALAILILLVGCGGGGSSSNNSSNTTTSTSQSNVGHAQGVYSGTTSSSFTFETIVLPNDVFYGIYGTVSGNLLLVDGMVTGQGSSGATTFTANINDFLFNGTVNSGSVNATYVAGSSINGTVAETGSPAVTFSGAAIPATQFNYNSAASLSQISGSWTGTLLDGSTATVSVQSSGSFSGTDSGCNFSGTITPDSSGKNFFNITLTFGGSPCLRPGQSATGIAVDYLLANGVNRQLLAAGTSGSTFGAVFVATR